MSENSKYKNYMNQRVIIRCSEKDSSERYRRIIGKAGTIIKISGSAIGVLIDGEVNIASSYGAYWFTKNELKFLENESEDTKMEGFKNVAIVNLIDDYNNKDYAFALYDEEYKLIYVNGLVVVNAKGKNNRFLGTVKDIMSVEEYYDDDKNKGIKITAEVVGIVNMDGYLDREKEKVRLAELEKKKAAIERELEAEINKRKSIEYYEAMAQKYSDNPKLVELVAELRNIGI